MAEQRLLDDLASWMDAEGAAAREPDYLEAVFTSTRTLRQRKAWAFPERWLPWLPVGRPVRLAFRVLVVAALTLALLAALILGWAGGRAVLFGDAVAGSGWRMLDGEPVAYWTMDAHVDPWTGVASGRYTFERDGGFFVADVTCARIAGSRAVVGGRITGGNTSEAGFLVWFDDGGAPAGGPPGTDALTFTPTWPTDPAWPPELPGPPATCPSIDPTPGVEWRMNEGEITVIDR